MMSKKDELNAALIAAMKSHDEVKKVPLKLVMAAVKLAEIETKEKLDDPDVIRIIQKEVKSLNELIADAEKAERDDLIATAKAEREVLQEFLPAGLSEEELLAIVKDAITESGAASPAEMGAVMKILMPKVQGRTDGSQVSQLVKQELQG